MSSIIEDHTFAGSDLRHCARCGAAAGDHQYSLPDDNPSTEHWTSDVYELLHFGRTLADAGWINTADDAFYYLEKARKYDVQHAIWIDCGCPDTEHHQWDEFINQLEASA